MAGNNPTARNDFIKSIEKIDQSTFPDENERHAALDAARALCMRLGTSMDHMVYMSLIFPSTQLALRTALNMGVIHKLAQIPDTQWTTAQLAEEVSADPVLLARLLKQLAAYGCLAEIDADIWASNQFTCDLTDPRIGCGMDFLFDMMMPSHAKAPDFLANTGYSNPTSTTEGIWQHATDSVGEPIFVYMNSRPQMTKNFMNFMSGYTFRKQKWIDIYPAKELFDGDKGGPLVVDLGGGTGSDLTMFLKAYPEATGRLFLQDQPGVIENFKDTGAIKPMVHDFFTPQPIHGSRVYLLHAVFHDWSDEECGAILTQIKPAMISGYSKVIVVDFVIPAKGAHPEATSMDMTMLTLTGAWERTEQQWTALFKAVGFKIAKIHRGRLESVIEADLE